MFKTARGKFTIGIVSALLVVVSAYGYWNFARGKFQSSAETRTFTVSGVVNCAAPCSARNAGIKLLDDAYKFVKGGSSNYFGNYSVTAVPFGSFYLVAYKDCGPGFTVYQVGGPTQSWTSGRCESNAEHIVVNQFSPGYPLSIGGPPLQEDQKKIGYFAVRVVQNTCPPKGGTNCIHPIAGAKVLNPWTGETRTTNQYGVARIDLIAGTWRVSAEGVNGKTGDTTINTVGCDGSNKTIQVAPAYQ